MDLLSHISESLQKGDSETVLKLTKEAIDEGKPPKEILDNGLIAGMNIIGKLFKDHEIFLPDVLLAAKAMYAGMDEIKPLLIKEGIKMVGKVIIGSVKGDLHDIGKNLVGIMLKGAGFDVIDLGTDVTPEKFVQTAKDEQAQIIGMSALLTTTMPIMKDVVEKLKEENLYGSVKVIIGGAPISEQFSKEIGAHGYGYDAASAVDIAKDLI